MNADYLRMVTNNSGRPAERINVLNEKIFAEARNGKEEYIIEYDVEHDSENGIVHPDNLKGFSKTLFNYYSFKGHVIDIVRYKYSMYEFRHYMKVTW